MMPGMSHNRMMLVMMMAGVMMCLIMNCHSLCRLNRCLLMIVMMNANLNVDVILVLVYVLLNLLCQGHLMRMMMMMMMNRLWNMMKKMLNLGCEMRCCLRWFLSRILANLCGLVDVYYLIMHLGIWFLIRVAFRIFNVYFFLVMVGYF